MISTEQKQKILGSLYDLLMGAAMLMSICVLGTAAIMVPVIIVKYVGKAFCS